MKTVRPRFLAALSVVFCCAAALLAGCAEDPVARAPQPAPAASLRYETLEGQDVSHLSLFFTLEAENPRDEAAGILIQGWAVSLDGRELGPDARLEAEGLLPEGGAAFPVSALAAGETRNFPLVLNLNLERFLEGASVAGNGGEAEAALDLQLVYVYPTSGRVTVSMRTRVVFPLIREPQFKILSIGIKKAELINTRFLVKISVNNPNAFPLDLSAFSYELYNGSRFWAGGTAPDVLNVPAKSSAETELFLMMNFIDMRRGLLDEIIALRQVDYRFAGTALVDTGVAFLPHFEWAYDQSGRSAVTE
jgi:LEA14-like dessication related protein